MVDRRSLLKQIGVLGALMSLSVPLNTKPMQESLWGLIMPAENIHPYSVLAEDPTSEAVICWIDDDTEHAGDTQTLLYGTDEDDLDNEVEVEGEEIPAGDGEHLYEVEITELTPDTVYFGEVQCHSGVKSIEIKTFPISLADNDLKILYFSDTHINPGSAGDHMDEPEMIEPLADEDPDLVLCGGDIVTGAREDPEPDDTEEWLRWWTEYWAYFAEGRLPPLIMVPGNHEVDNSSWDGTGSVDPEAGYFQFWFKHPRDLEPTGKNYCEVTIGDYLQILALDTHSEFPDVLADWLEDAINEDVDVALPFHHSPLMTGASRRSGDDDLQELLREEWAPIYHDAGNVYATFSGHIHTRKRTEPWIVVDEEPDSDAFELPGGQYLTVSENSDGIVGFGDGWRDNRGGSDEWFLDDISGDTHFNVIHIDRNSPATMTVEEIDDSGELINSEEYDVEVLGDDDQVGVDLEEEYGSYGKLRTDRVEL